MIHSYPSIYNLGHKAVAEIFADPVLVQEKVDGSQFSFGLYGPTTSPDMAPGDVVYDLGCRSKGAHIQMVAPEKMFAAAVDTVKALGHLLRPNWTYRGEYLAKPKHNVIAYTRVPARNVILFDINPAQEDYLPYVDVVEEAQRLGLEVVPLLYTGWVESLDMFRTLLDTDAFLGGSKVEGVVVKNYRRYTVDKKAMMGKFVSEAFKEVHAAEWKRDNPNPGDILERMVATYRSPARWAKAVQHLQEAGQLAGDPTDIGLLFKEVPADIRKECEGEIKAALFAWAWPRIQRGTTAGMAEWYKENLLAKQFTNEST